MSKNNKKYNNTAKNSYISKCPGLLKFCYNHLQIRGGCMMRKNFVKRTSALALAAFMAASAAGCSSGGGSRTAAAPDTTAQAAASGEEAKADGIRGKQKVQGNRLPSVWYTIWASRPRGTRWMPCWLHLTRPILKSMWMWKWLHPHPILQPIKLYCCRGGAGHHVRKTTDHAGVCGRRILHGP